MSPPTAPSPDIIAGQEVKSSVADTVDDRPSALVLEHLAAEKRDAGDNEEALKLYQQALAKAVEEKPSVNVLARLRIALAILLDHADKEEDAVPVYEQAIKDLAEVQPPDLVTGGQLRNNLAMIYKRQSRFALAEQHYLAAIESMESALGRETEDVSSLYNNLGGLYYAAGFPDQAKEMFTEAMEIRLKLLGPDHPDMAQSYCNLATVHYELGDNAEAQFSYERSLRILEAHIQDEAASFEAVGLDYIAMLGALQEDAKAEAFQKHLKSVLEKHQAK